MEYAGQRPQFGGERQELLIHKIGAADPSSGFFSSSASTSRSSSAGTASTTYAVGDQLATWQEIGNINGRLYADAQMALLVGSWLLSGLALAGVAGIVAGRIIGQRRRVGLLKAVGAGPAMIAAVHLAEYLVIGLAAAATGLAAGWFAAPVLIRPSVGLIGSVNAQPPRCAR